MSKRGVHSGRPGPRLKHKCGVAPAFGTIKILVVHGGMPLKDISLHRSVVYGHNVDSSWVSRVSKTAEIPDLMVFDPCFPDILCAAQAGEPRRTVLVNARGYTSRSASLVVDGVRVPSCGLKCLFVEGSADGIYSRAKTRAID